MRSAKLRQLSEDVMHRPMGSVHSSLSGIAEARRRAREQTKSKKKPAWFAIKNVTVNIARRNVELQPHCIRHWDGALFTHEITDDRPKPTIFACRQEADAFLNKSVHLAKRPFGYPVPLTSLT